MFVHWKEIGITGSKVIGYRPIEDITGSKVIGYRPIEADTIGSNCHISQS